MQKSKNHHLPSRVASPNLTADEKELLNNLADYKWRLRNLYFIKDKHGKKTLFKPNWAQEILLDNLWFFSIILKARQLGCTTFFCILFLDQVLFNENKTAGIIAHKEKDAKSFFQDKVKFAWDNLSDILKDTLGPPNTDSVGELSFPNGSKIFVSTSVRGGTLQFLHVSEFGKICATFPHKAKEIVTGSINAVEQGNFVTIESTAEGREGYFYDFCQEAQRAEIENRKLSPLEFKFFFFPWWKEATYSLKESDLVITAAEEDYFQSLLEKHNIILTDGQKRWYVNKRRTNADSTLQEFPSTPEEAFMVSIEGAYYTSQLAKVYADRRVRPVPYDSALPVETWWDLGVNDENVILFTQKFGNEIRFIDFYSNHGEGLAHYINVLNSRGYVYERHVFPHDIEVTELSTGISRRKSLLELGLKNVHTVERTKSVNDDIEGVRKLFSRFYFDEVKCAAVVDSLASYKKEWDDKLGVWKDRPRHDKNSHIADAMRLLVHGWRGQEIGGNNPQEEYSDFF
jgi:hypothetical protein